MSAADMYSSAAAPARGAWVSLWIRNNTRYVTCSVGADPSPTATSLQLACHRYSCVLLCYNA